MDMPTSERDRIRVDLAHESPFALGPLTVEPAFRRILRDEREAILEPKVMRVLVALARKPGIILSRDDLIETCWDGRIVGDAAIDRAISLLRTALRDMAGEAVTLETIARVGYRIHAEAAPDAPAGVAGPVQAMRAFALPRRGMWLAFAILALLAGGGAWWMLRPAEEAVAIAVLPFRSLSPGEEYFADGLGEEIATQLAAEPALRVAGRRSTEMFAERKVNIREMGTGLGVEYLLDGSVRRDGERVRIDVSLTRTDDGISQWSRSFDGKLEDVLAMQRDVGRAVLAGLHREVASTRPAEKAVTTSGALYREYLTARALLRERDRPKIIEAKALLEGITKLDPGFAPAWAERAQAESLQYFFDPAYTDAKQAAAERRALAFVDRAISLAPDLSDGYATRALVQHHNGPTAIPDLRRAVALDPSNAEAWYWLAGACKSEGRYAEALEAFEKVAELDPFWVRTEVAAPFMWDMGERDRARALVERMAAFAPDQAQRQSAQAQLAAWRGDWSGYILHLNEAMKLTSNAEQRFIWGIGRNSRLARLGIPFKVVALPIPTVITLADALAGDVPSLERIATSNGSERGFWEAPVHPYVFPRMLINEGRSADVVRLYDVAFGSPESMDEASGIELVGLAPDLAVALRNQGRGREADRLLALASAEIARVRGIGPVPGTFEERAARVHAVRGERDQAIASLKRAVALGWPDNDVNRGDWLVPPFATEPAYATILGDPWVRDLDRRIQANLAKERREAMTIKLVYPARPGA